MDSIWIALECRQLNVENPRETKSLFSSVINNVKAIATKGFDRSDQRFVKISVTEPFPLGSPSHSMNYENVFISDRSANNPFPRFFQPVHIQCPESKDLSHRCVLSSIHITDFSHPTFSRYGPKSQIDCHVHWAFRKQRGLGVFFSLLLLTQMRANYRLFSLSR